MTGTILSNLDWTLGGFYYKGFDSNQGFGEFFPDFLDSNLDSHDTQTTEDWAGFVHGIYHLTDKLDIIGGVRYTKDTKNAIIQRFRFPRWRQRS